MDEAKIRHQVRQMAQVGCGGFFIHPRQGLTVTYLSKTYFERIKIAVEEAAKCGIEAWLYDEYPYPSGIAGGLLTANHPEMRERIVKNESFVAPPGQPIKLDFELGRVISAVACPIENGRANWDAARDLRDEIGVVLTREQFWLWPMGHIPTNEKRFMADEGRLVLEWNPPPGEWQISICIEREQRGFKYFDCFFDPLHPGAAAAFLRITHERYAAAVGEFFGTTIPGIFTDETEPPAWSPHIESALNLDWRDVAALWDASHPRADEVRLAWRECALQLFQERWETPIAHWCREHNLIWGAEKPTWRPAQFWNVDEPATDAGHRRIPAPPEPLTTDLRANARAAIAAAEQCGNETVRCECFHSLGWGATLQDQKWQFDWLCAQGVNRFTPHAFYATSAGLKKHDAAPSFFAENPYWPHFGLLADYVARLSLAMSCGREAARVAVIYPTQALWLRDQKVRENFEQLCADLLAHHVQFHVVDAQALLDATPRAGALELGRARYETVFACGESAARTQAENAGLAVCESEDWPVVARDNPLQIRDENGAELPAIWSLWRETENQQLLFFANTGGDAATARIEVTASAKSWEQWSLESGESSAFFAEIADGKNYFTLDLPPYGSALVVGTAESVPQSGACALFQSKKLFATRLEEGASPAPIIPLEGEWEIRLDRPNALRLNRWRAASGDADCSAPEWDDENWREIEALPLQFREPRGANWKNQIEWQGGETVWYRRRVECEWVPQNLEILIENGAIAGDWRLFINGEAVPVAAFAAREYNGEDKIAARVADYFQTGENVLALQIENAPALGGLLTPLHLLGDFSLNGENRRTLAPLTQTARFNDLVGAGLPHFSGCVTYKKSLDLKGARRVQLPADFGDIAQLWVDGQNCGVRAWSPYVWELPAMNGAVTVEIAVTNTLLPFVEGQVWDFQLGTLANV